MSLLIHLKSLEAFIHILILTCANHLLTMFMLSAMRDSFMFTLLTSSKFVFGVCL
jgi:hypothetical protein